MANITTAKQQNLAQAAQAPKFSDFLNSQKTKESILQIIGKNTQRFMTAILSAVSTNPNLANCTHGTILSGALLGETLNLSPSPQLGQYYLVPFSKKDKEGNILETNAQFILGYKGYLQLAMRSGYYADIDVMEIKEGEYCGRDKQTGKFKFSFTDNEEERDELPTVGYMAYFEYANGFKKVIYWSKERMLKHANTYSSAFNAAKYVDLLAGKIPEKDKWKYSSFWYKNFDEMAFKTLLRHLISRWGIMSIEMQQALSSDSAVIGENLQPSLVEPQDLIPQTPQLTSPASAPQMPKPTQEEQAEFDFFDGSQISEDMIR